jgi:hypothetical protein
MQKLALRLIALCLGGVALPAFAADMIPYGNPGHVASTTPVTSTGTTLDVYFYGSDASDTDYIQVKDVTQGWTSNLILDNHTSAVGLEFIFPTGSNQLNSGDALEFSLVNQSTNETYSSIPGDSADGYNHAYITPFSGNGTIPAGTFVGFEDLFIGANSDKTCTGNNNQSDCDYNDDEFVFVGVTPQGTPAAPEPSSLALLGTSVLGAAAMVRRRFIRR